MKDAGLCITIVTTLHQYIVRRDQVLELRVGMSKAELERPDERGKSVISCELGTLLDPRDMRSNPRRHALVIPTRRWSVALLVERVEDIRTATRDHIQKLPPLLARRLERPWFLGVFVAEENPMLVLDLRQIAQDVLMMKSQERKKAREQQPASLQ